MTRVSIASAVLVAVLIVGSCDHAPPPVDRAGRLLAMAGEEAANIPNKLDRFTRQLNIADTQLRTDRKGDAAATLGRARDTLNAASKTDFDDFHRIAAWTAISQLSRQADDRDMALKASDNAMAALNDVLPLTERPQYVLSLSWELADLRGKQAAIELLESGSAWAAEIKDQGTRRIALMTFAQQLISLDAFENARNTLRRDSDAAWRTDMFLALANQNTVMPPGSFAMRNTANAGMVMVVGGRGGRGGGGGGGFSVSAASQQNAASESNWNKDVRYENVFREQQ